jgi:hypothetical protein
MRLGGLQSRSGRSGEEKNSQPLPDSNPLIMQPVAQRYTAELYEEDYPRDLLLLEQRNQEVYDGLHM